MTSQSLQSPRTARKGTPTPSEIRVFLESLFAGKPDDLYILLWTLHGKRSHWFRSVPDAIRCAEELHHLDLYVGIGLANREHGATRRCPSEEIVGIVGICADIDLRSDAHLKATLPSTIEQALSILPAELPPTLIILTGNGIQVWWLFRELYIFETDDERRAAATLANRWHTLLRDNASQHGWTYERLADLARVLRVPGTTNCKDASNPKPVVIHSQSDRRYNPCELTEYLDELAVPDTDAEESTVRAWAQRFEEKPLTLNLAARIPEETVNQWLEADARFKNTWFRQRQDLPDQSQSGYDLALACFGLGAGLTDQEVVNLLVHHRSIHGQKPRTGLNYFYRTLSKAANRSGDAIKIRSAAGTPAGETADGAAWAENHPERAKIELCRQISAALGVEVLRIVKLSGKEPLYRMELAEGMIEFGTVGKLISYPVVREAIAARVGKLMPRINPRAWNKLAQMMLSACIVEEGSEELEYEGSARLFLDRYLSEIEFIASPEGQIAQNIRKPMVREGLITVCAGDLQMHINKTTMQNLSVRAVAAMLSAIGAKALRVRGKKGREQSRWQLPLNEFSPSDYLTSETDTQKPTA